MLRGGNNSLAPVPWVGAGRRWRFRGSYVDMWPCPLGRLDVFGLGGFGWGLRSPRACVILPRGRRPFDEWAHLDEAVKLRRAVKPRCCDTQA